MWIWKIPTRHLITLGVFQLCCPPHVRLQVPFLPEVRQAPNTPWTNHNVICITNTLYLIPFSNEEASGCEELLSHPLQTQERHSRLKVPRKSHNSSKTQTGKDEGYMGRKRHLSHA